MRCVNVTVVSIFMPIFLVAMDQPTKGSASSSIIALDVFDNSQANFTQQKLVRESNLFAQIETQENQQFSSFQIGEDDTFVRKQKLFQEYLRAGEIDKVISVLERGDLQKKNPLVEKLWHVYQNKSAGFTISPFEHYEEAVLPRVCIEKGALLLACKVKNRIFLNNYQQKYGIEELLKIIGNANFETMYGALALKAILGPKAYREYADLELNTRVLAHIAKFEGSCADDEILD